MIANRIRAFGLSTTLTIDAAESLQTVSPALGRNRPLRRAAGRLGRQRGERAAQPPVLLGQAHSPAPAGRGRPDHVRAFLDRVQRRRRVPLRAELEPSIRQRRSRPYLFDNCS